MIPATNAFVAAASGQSTDLVTLAVITGDDNNTYYFSDAEVGTSDGLNYNYSPVLASCSDIGLSGDALGAIRDGGIFTETVTLDIIKSAASDSFIRFIIARGVDRATLALYRWYRDTADADKLMIGTFYGQNPVNIAENTMICSLNFVGTIAKAGDIIITPADRLIVGKANFFIPFGDFWQSGGSSLSVAPVQGTFTRLKSDISYTHLGITPVSNGGVSIGTAHITTVTIDEERIEVQMTVLGEMEIVTRGVDQTTPRPHLAGALVLEDNTSYMAHCGSGDPNSGNNSASVYYDGEIQPGSYIVEESGTLIIGEIPTARIDIKPAPMVQHDTIHCAGYQGYGHSEEYDPDGYSGIFNDPENINNANGFSFVDREVIFGVPPLDDTWYHGLCYVSNAPASPAVGAIDNVTVSIDYAVSEPNEPKINKNIELVIRYVDDNGDDVEATIGYMVSVADGDTGTLSADASGHIKDTSRLASVEIGVKVSHHKDNSDPDDLPGAFNLQIDFANGLLWDFDVVPEPSVQPDYHIVIEPMIIRAEVTSTITGADPTPPEIVKHLVDTYGGGSLPPVDMVSFNAATTAYNDASWYINGYFERDLSLADAIREVMFLACGALSTYGGVINFVTAYDLEDSASPVDATIVADDWELTSRALTNNGDQGVVNNVRATSSQFLDGGGVTGGNDTVSINYYGERDLSFDTDLIGSLQGLTQVCAMMVMQRSAPVLLYKMELYQKYGLRIDRGDRVTFDDYFGVNTGVVVDVKRNMGNGTSQRMSTHTCYVLAKAEAFAGGGDA